MLTDLRALSATELLDRMAATDAAIQEQQATDPDAAAGARRQLDARRHHDTWDRLATITAPTLVAAGRRDGIAAVANSEALVSRLPRGELRVYEGGHLFLLQDRSAWSDIVTFLSSPAPAGA